ncbi:hypothetical protein [Clostridium sp.]|jgi:hypothetical protein|uniref:hypothetical protein n=1 Tax=Clostridium sp. TaxID=1506 RepID=UPI002589C86F|nr:hypothetical protein [Clostridium sp.]MDF2502566.1 hypothetical protein [Clostridium sp.]
MIELTIHEFLNDNIIATEFPLDISNWELIKSIKEFNENTKQFFHTITTIHNYLVNPKLLAWTIWSGVVKYSFSICLLVCLFGIIAYLAGINKGKKFAKISFGVYLLITMFNAALS